MPVIVKGRELVKVQPRVDFAPDEFRAQIQGWGHRMRWERAMRCPCNLQLVDRYDPTITALSRVGLTGCPGCDGVGYQYAAAQTIKALVNDPSSDQRFLQVFGEMAFGAVRLSLLPEHLPAWRDRFIDLDGARLYQEEPRVRVDAVEQPTYPILTRSMLVGDDDDPTRTVARDLGVVVLRKADANGVLLEDEPVEGVDFRITDAGAIEFLDDSAGVGPPAVGQAYSLVYTTCPTWTVRNHPHLYRHTYVAQKPFVNAVDGYRGEWAASDGAFPSGSHDRGDYYEVIDDGVVDGVNFVAGDVLVARVDSPADDSAADWARIGDTDTAPEPELVPLTVMALCWLEDLGDPFGRTGVP